MEVLTCKLALEGKKTALVVDSIKAIVELLDYFDKLNIKAVPVWGYTGKETRKRKAYSSIEEEDFSDIKVLPGINGFQKRVYLTVYVIHQIY